MYCTENSEINDEMDGVEGIDSCSESQTENGELHEGKESTKQECRDKKSTQSLERNVNIGLGKVSL